MTIRFRKVSDKELPEIEMKGIKITEKNIDDLPDYIRKRGGIVLLTTSGGKKPPRLRLKQLNVSRSLQGRGKVRYKRDWRVAEIGDYIILVEGKEFYRIKRDSFAQNFR